MTFVRTACATLLLLGHCPASAAVSAYVPETDATVLQRLPGAGRDDAAWRDIRHLRERLRAQPHDAGAAGALAWAYLRLGQRTADARFFGYARAALDAWWGVPDPPPALRLARAVLEERAHRFAVARSDLEAVLEREPRDARAWLIYANHLELTGDPRAALVACGILHRLRAGLAPTACAASAAGLLGRDDEAVTALSRTLAASQHEPPALRRWAHAVLAGSAARLGRTADADASYRAALALNPAPDHVLADYVRFLLDADRADDALEIIGDGPQPDAIEVLRTIAMQDPHADARRTALLARLAAARQRGDVTHPGLEAELLLASRDAAEARRAVTLAARAFALARTPVEARLLLQAARAAGDPQAARPVLDWMDDTGIRDRRLARLAAGLSS